MEYSFYRELGESEMNREFNSIFKTSGHSTGIALLQVKNDILMSTDQSKAVVLVLLDLSAAFDTID